MKSISGLLKEHEEFISQHYNDAVFIEKHREMTKILQYERAMHLIVMMFTILFTFLILILFYISQITSFLLLFAIFLLLSLAYLLFYFKIENTVVKWEHILKNYRGDSERDSKS